MSEATVRAEPIGPEEYPTTSPTRVCYHCGADLPLPGARACAECGRRQIRTCFCGATIPRGPVTCPECGTDWTKVRRRSRRSVRSRKRSLMTHCVAGGAIALGIAAVLYVLTSYVVDAAAGAAASAASAAGALGGVWRTIAGHGLEIGAVALVTAIGALSGVARYHIRESRRGARERRPERER